MTPNPCLFCADCPDGQITKWAEPELRKSRRRPQRTPALRPAGPLTSERLQPLVTSCVSLTWYQPTAHHNRNGFVTFCHFPDPLGTFFERLCNLFDPP